MNEIQSKATSVDKERYKAIRERWDHEDKLLGSRTGAFLATNSILFAALGLQEQDKLFAIGVAVVGLILSGLWLTTSWHSFNIIRKLYEACKGGMPYDLENTLRQEPILFRPNTVFCFLVPGLIIIGWFAYIGYTIYRLVSF